MLIFCLFFSFSALARISIISDLDDTVKITEAGGKPTDIIGDDIFTGMSEFFVGAKGYSTSLHILSASPTFMSPIIKRTLKKRGIEYKGLILRGNLAEEKFTYKVRKIREILDATSDDVVLIGDDLGQDPEAYSEIKKLYPGRVLAIYIHVLNGRAITSDATPYWTSFDLFLREEIAGRMDPSWVERGIKVLTNENQMNLVFPKKAQCPKSPFVYSWQIQSQYQQEALKLTYKFVKFCLQRQSVNILP